MMRSRLIAHFVLFILLPLSFANASADEFQDLAFTFDFDPPTTARATIGYGDPLYLRLMITNSATESRSILSPKIRPPKYTFVPRELTAGFFTWVNFPIMGFSVGDVVVPAGGHVCMLDVVTLPLSDVSKNDFWRQERFILEADLTIRHEGDERSSVRHSALAQGEVDVISRSEEQIALMQSVEKLIWQAAGVRLDKTDMKSRVAANQELRLTMEKIQPGSFRNSIHARLLLNQLEVSSDDHRALEETAADMLQWLDQLNQFERHARAMTFVKAANRYLPVSCLEALKSRLYDYESCSDDCSSRMDAGRIERAILSRKNGAE